MGKKKIVMLAFAALLCLVPALVHGAEKELFDTEVAAVHTEKGIAFLKAKNYDAAIKEFEESVSIAPDAEGFYYLGYAYYMIGKKKDGEFRKKAMENFNKAYELDPNFTPTRLGSAEAGTEKVKPKQGEAPASGETATLEVQPAAPAEEQPAEQPRTGETTTQPEQSKESASQPQQPAQTGEPAAQPGQTQPATQPNQ